MIVFDLVIAAAITTIGDSVAITVLDLEPVAEPSIGVHAYAISVGPLGPWEPDTSYVGELTLIRNTARLLRVTLYRCERSEWLTIDDISLQSGDSRSILAQYRFPLFPGLGGLWIRPDRPGLPRPRAGPPSVMWLSASGFFIPYPGDTLFVEHLGGGQFGVTMRACTDYVSSEEYTRIADSLRTHAAEPRPSGASAGGDHP